MSISGWVGVDLDATLANYDGWKGEDNIGEPIPEMVEKVKAKLAEGVKVKIFTARVCITGEFSDTSKRTADFNFSIHQTEIIKAWCLKHLGEALEVTCVKDFACIEIWDDRARGVVPNTGRFVGEIL